MVIIVALRQQALAGVLLELVARLVHYLVDFLYAVNFFGVLEGQPDSRLDLGNIRLKPGALGLELI